MYKCDISANSVEKVLISFFHVLYLARIKIICMYNNWYYIYQNNHVHRFIYFKVIYATKQTKFESTK